jgi:hypothetical protein
MDQVVEHLPRKYKALSSNPSTGKRKEGKKKNLYRNFLFSSTLTTVLNKFLLSRKF